MFDVDLFFSLCEKYDVQLSNTEAYPMMKDREQMHVITKDDVHRIFISH